MPLLAALSPTFSLTNRGISGLKELSNWNWQKKPHEFTGKINSAEALRNLRNKYDKNTQTSYIGVVVVYGIVAVEAFVDAHLQNFDISDDLSLRLKGSGVQFLYTFQN